MSAAQAVAASLAVVAVIALAGFAVWVSVADAPWEEQAPVVVDEVDRTGEIRCEGALRLREVIIEAGPYVAPSRTFREGVAVSEGNPSGVPNYSDQLAQADREIQLYC